MARTSQLSAGDGVVGSVRPVEGRFLPQAVPSLCRYDFYSNYCIVSLCLTSQQQLRSYQDGGMWKEKE